LQQERTLGQRSAMTASGQEGTVERRSVKVSNLRRTAEPVVHVAELVDNLEPWRCANAFTNYLQQGRLLEICSSAQMYTRLNSRSNVVINALWKYSVVQVHHGSQ
jgi:hypothetical protein